MNKDNLQLIFKKYIKNFELLNNKVNNETYKWEIAQEFQNFDIDAEDFADMLSLMWKASGNLIDNSQQLPFYALIDYARKEPERVREMFRILYADEYLDTASKQTLINDFIIASEELRKKHFPDSRMYVNDQRSVMMYLFLRYPNSNFGYKAKQAKSFADCIEFYEDWGPMSAFHPDVYEHMCEQIIEEIKKDDALLETHKSRYENTDKKLHADENYHILLFDIIFSSQTYDFYDGITFSPINAKSRKLYFERVEKAKELSARVEKAKADANKLDEAKAYIDSVITVGMILHHKTFGEGTIKKRNDLIVSVYFPKIDITKILNIATVIGNGIGSFSSAEINEKIKYYTPVLNREYQIPAILTSAINALQPYAEYLD